MENLNEQELHELVLKVIENICDVFELKYKRDPWSYFLNGNCMYFSEILMGIFGDKCKPYASDEHTICEIGNRHFYDVTGEIKDKEELKKFYIDIPYSIGYFYQFYELATYGINDIERQKREEIRDFLSKEVKNVLSHEYPFFKEKTLKISKK